MFRKHYSELSAIKHVLTWTIGTPLFLISLGVVPYLLFVPDPQNHEIAIMAIVGGFVGVILGPFIGLFAWLFNRGLHAGFGLVRDIRGNVREGQYQARLEEAAEANHVHQVNHDVIHGEVVQDEDPWHGTNPYGCCQTNYDADGVLHHGSADCRHPLIVPDAQR